MKILPLIQDLTVVAFEKYITPKVCLMNEKTYKLLASDLTNHFPYGDMTFEKLLEIKDITLNITGNSIICTRIFKSDLEEKLNALFKTSEDNLFLMLVESKKDKNYQIGEGHLCRFIFFNGEGTKKIGVALLDQEGEREELTIDKEI